MKASNIDWDAYCAMEFKVVPPWKHRDADFIDAISQPEPSKPHQYSQAAEEAGKRMGFAPFAYEERS